MSKGNAKHTSKSNRYQEQTKLAREIFGVVLIVIGILFGLCVFTSSEAIVLFALRNFAFGSLGAVGYICPLLFIIWGLAMIFADRLKVKAGTAIMCVVGILSLISLVHLLSPYGSKFDEGFFGYIARAYEKGYENIAGGGAIGAVIAFPLSKYLGTIAGAVILIALILVSAMVVCRFSLRAAGIKIGRRVKSGAHMAAEKIKEEKPKREERLRQKVEREAFQYTDEMETSNYPKGTAYNEVLEDEEELTAAKDYDDYAEDADFEEDGCEYEDYEDADFEDDQLEEEREEFPFDKPAEYEVDDDSLVEGAEFEEYDELDLSGLRIIDKMHGRAVSRESYRADSKKKSYDFTVDASDDFVEKDYSLQDTDEADEAYELYAEDEQEALSEQNISGFDGAEGEEEVLADKPIRSIPVAPKPKREKKFKLPSVELLDKPKTSAFDNINSKNEIDEYARKLEDTFESFGVNIKVVNASRGPKVTRYELQPAAGVKIAKIKALGDDIALNMAAESVRIEAPIPGKSFIGIELPNKTYVSVCIRELIDNAEFKSFKAELPFVLGKDIAGKKIFDDLAKMPHLLVAGTTGSGKSVCLNTIIMSLIFRLPPEELQFIMIDPKMVEMAVYNGIPNLKVPVVMDKAKAAGALVWAVTEMENRYKLFQSCGVRNIKTYNQKRKEASEPVMAKLVIVIDEFADLMMVSAKDVEDAVCRIAQLGRAAGIHLIIATQSPRADIFTGLIKANVPSRIALTVGNALESRIIMDEMGAEKLLGNGDMLYRPVGKNKATRIQGCWISDEEIYRVTEYLKSVGDAKYDDEVESEMAKIAEQTGKSKEQASNLADNADMDSLLPQAVSTVLEFEQASASMLQRKMRVGYSRAARLMDQLEEIGAVGPSEGSKGRQILWTWADYNEHFGAAEGRLGGDMDDEN